MRDQSTERSIAREHASVLGRVLAEFSSSVLVALACLTTWCPLPASAVDHAPPSHLRAAEPVTLTVEALGEIPAPTAYVRRDRLPYVAFACSPTRDGGCAATVPASFFSGGTVEYFLDFGFVPERPERFGTAEAPLALTPAPPRSNAVDATPPTLLFEVPATLPRDTPFIVRARISDESGVFAPGVYWRNAYLTGWDSAPLVLERDDVYRADLASTAVTQGFAFYIEAYDKLGNGPTLRGSPEQPVTPALTEAGTAPAWVPDLAADTSEVTNVRREWGRGALLIGAVLLAGAGTAGAVRVFASDFQTRAAATTPANLLLLSGVLIAGGGGVLLATSPSTP